MTEIENIGAVTLNITDMQRSVIFYRALGFRPIETRSGSKFTTFALRSSFLNLIATTQPEATGAPSDTRGPWGRVILYVSDVDALYHRARAAGLSPEFAPRDASWGERYFHLKDPDGHEVSFARQL